MILYVQEVLSISLYKMINASWTCNNLKLYELWPHHREWQQPQGGGERQTGDSAQGTLPIAGLIIYL